MFAGIYGMVTVNSKKYEQEQKCIQEVNCYIIMIAMTWKQMG